MIKSHPGLKPLEEVDSEMSELIAQEQRRQACVPRPKPLRERERGALFLRAVSRRVRVDASTPLHAVDAPPWRARAARDSRRHATPHRTPSTRRLNTVHVHRAHRVGELRQ